MKSVDDIPYALVGAVLGAVCAFPGNLLFHRYAWQIGAAPIAGGVLGYVAGIMALRSKRLSASSTMAEMKLALRREREKPEISFHIAG